MRAQLVKFLSDGAFHSGTELGKKLGITRAAVCKNIHRLKQLGLDVHSVTGRGYKLDQPLFVLDKKRILKFMGASAPTDLRDRLYIIDQVDSTNRFLSERVSQVESVRGVFCLAEMQRAGRGRRGRAWVATPYSNLMLSMAWEFPGGPGMVTGLSLAAGVAVRRALEEYGVSDAMLKWPNDVLWNGRKLAGLLVEVQGEAAGPTRVILGVGVNARINRNDAGRIDQPWVDMRDILGKTIDRNRLAALVIRHLLSTFQTFSEKGFAPFRKPWQSHHYYQGRRVRLIQGDGEYTGTVEGINDDGGLMIRHAKARKVYHSGEISLRSAG
ncbi:MAG: bifunctional biotin--[acetyl-CoA-carboxylase] ligase/biotin operon repressor BirA [Sulfuricaulis sp.]|uniref:bifunctional biotin--[acetyl-CoA-carboxylase] ligase/biotin operon repressor BirA n=1 Tax=Sulfuricaulis sp. TaxID=2003553 RepID=UPI0034A3B11D